MLIYLGLTETYQVSFKKMVFEEFANIHTQFNSGKSVISFIFKFSLISFSLCTSVLCWLVRS